MISRFLTKGLLLGLLILTGCSSKKSESQINNLTCADYTWNDIERLVAPYVPDELYTSLVMQAQSSEYKVSAAADHAIGLSNSYPDSVISILKKLQKLDC